jgi:hypothetical protein
MGWNKCLRTLCLVLFSFSFLAVASTEEEEKKALAQETQNVEAAKKAASDVVEGLKGKLSEQMAKNLVNSVEYCHDKAITLTKDFSTSHPQVTEIKRTSLKIRNPINAPDKLEKKMLEKWDKMAKAGKDLPEYEFDKISENEFRYYKPLKVTNMCLTCHGQPAKDLSATIKAKYPKDKATGYKEGEFRGLIRVSVKPINLSN